MIKLKGLIPNEDERGWPGEFVRVFLEIDIFKNVTVVPQASVIPGQDMEYVYIATKNKEGKLTASLRKVKTKLTFEGVTVIDWGLNPGEQIIVDGHGNVWDGAEIYVPKNTQHKDSIKK